MYSKLPIQKCRTLEIVYETIIASLNLLIFLIYNPQVQSALNTMALLFQNMFLFSENKINVQHYILHLLSNSVTDVWTVFFSSVFIQNVIKQTRDKITSKIQTEQGNVLKSQKKAIGQNLADDSDSFNDSLITSGQKLTHVITKCTWSEDEVKIDQEP